MPTVFLKRIILSAVVLFGGCLLFGQVRELDGGPVVPGMKILSISVLDSASRAPLPGATIELSREKDTLRAATDQYGLVMLFPQFGKDTVQTTISFLGYKTCTFRRLFVEPTIRLEVRLAESPQELSAIIVEAESVMMVVRGDTTIFKASAFQSMAGDRLENLLKKIPGIEIKGASVYALGRPVNKILVNGTTLFGSNIGAALQMIDSEIVKEVKVYDEHPQDRLVQADTLGRKDHVLDVVTKTKLTRVQELQLAASLGLFTDSEAAEKTAGGLSGRFNRFEQGRAQFSATGTLAENLENNLLLDRTVSTPERSFSSSVQYGLTKRFQSRKNFTFRFDLNRLHTLTQTEEEAVSAALYPDYLHQKQTDHLTGRGNGMATGAWAFKAGERNLFDLNFSAGWDRNRLRQWAHDALRTGGVLGETDIFRQDKETDLSGKVNVRYTRRFTKPGRNLILSSSFALHSGWGEGTRADTSAQSAAPQWMEYDLRSRSLLPEAGLSWQEPLGKGFSLEAGESFSLGRTFRDHPAEDRLMGVPDRINTYAYTQDNLTQIASLGLRYNKKRVFQAAASLQHRYLRQTRRETEPDIQSSQVAYSVFSPALHLEVNRPVFYLSGEYRESALCPTAAQLRPVVDNADPFFLMAGNPELELPVHRDLFIKSSLTTRRSASVWQPEVHVTADRNYIGYEIVRFQEDTPLPEYGYTAVSGSQLTRPVNLKGRRSWDASLSTSLRRQKMQATLTPRLSLAADRTPYSFSGQVLINRVRRANGLLTAMGNFGKTWEYSVYAGAGMEWCRNETWGGYDAFVPSAGGKVRWDPVDWLSFTVSGAYNGSHSGSSIRDYDLVRLDTGVDWVFGNKRQARIGVLAGDLLNNATTRSTSLSEQFIRTLVTNSLGRSVMLHAVYLWR